jgi:hypothetical protein
MPHASDSPTRTQIGIVTAAVLIADASGPRMMRIGTTYARTAGAAIHVEVHRGCATPIHMKTTTKKTPKV